MIKQSYQWAAGLMRLSLQVTGSRICRLIEKGLDYLGIDSRLRVSMGRHFIRVLGTTITES